MAKAKSVDKLTTVDDWQAEDDMRTLMRAEEIKRDAKRLAAAKACAKKKLEDLALVSATQALQD